MVLGLHFITDPVKTMLGFGIPHSKDAVPLYLGKGIVVNRLHVITDPVKIFPRIRFRTKRRPFLTLTQGGELQVRTGTDPIKIFPRIRT
jgi:hypothetical protein